MVQNKHGTIRLLKADFHQRRGGKSVYNKMKTKQRGSTLDGIEVTRIRRFLLFCDCAYDSVSYNQVKTRLSECLTQWQNECACSSRMSNLMWRNGDIFKIPIVCFRFAGISPNNKKIRLPLSGKVPSNFLHHISYSTKKYWGNRCEFGD